jgi:hypothetical protein
MRKQDDPSNPPGPSTGQGKDKVVVEIALSDDNNDEDNVQTFTFNSTKEGAATQDGTGDLQEDVNGPTRDLLSETYYQLQDDFLHNRAPLPETN